VSGRSGATTLLQHAGPLPDGQADLRLVFYGFSQTAYEPFRDCCWRKEGARSWCRLRPIFELVEITVIRIERIFGFVLGPIKLVRPPRHVCPRFFVGQAADRLVKLALPAEVSSDDRRPSTWVGSENMMAVTQSRASLSLYPSSSAL